MENKKNKVRLDESRVYEENGVVKVRHVINESTDVDMTPLPTESRVFVKDGKVITVYSEEINKTGTMSVEMGMQLSLEHIEKRHTIK
jgi:hypothetical protein